MVLDCQAFSRLSRDRRGADAPTGRRTHDGHGFPCRQSALGLDWSGERSCLGLRDRTRRVVIGRSQDRDQKARDRGNVERPFEGRTCPRSPFFCGLGIEPRGEESKGAVPGRVRIMERPWGEWRRPSTLPPWVAAVSRTMASPRPDPGRDDGASPWQKPSKMLGRRSAGTPGPSSLTSMTTTSSRRRAVTAAELPDGVWTPTLETRLSTAPRRSSSSPATRRPAAMSLFHSCSG